MLAAIQINQNEIQIFETENCANSFGERARDAETNTFSKPSQAVFPKQLKYCGCAIDFTRTANIVAATMIQHSGAHQ